MLKTTFMLKAVEKL